MFSAHLRDAKIYGELSKHTGGKACKVTSYDGVRHVWCVLQDMGRANRPPLTPISVSGPFGRVGVNVIQFPILATSMLWPLLTI